MTHPVTGKQRADLVSACMTELGMEYHPNTVTVSILEAPADRGHVVTVSNIRRGPLRVHVLHVAPSGEISRVRYNQKV